MTAPAGEDVLIRFEGVVKAFGEKRVLNGLDLDVHRGETVVVMGPSGTGKSTLLRHVIGLLRPDAGRVLVDGNDMATIRPRELRALRERMGYVFQDAALLAWMNVADNLALPLRETTDLSEREIERRVQEKLMLVHVPGSDERFPSELSGGMRKRVGLARALITDPEIVLYDEPTAGLDPEIAMSINLLMRELRERTGTTAMVVTHDIGTARTVADRIAFLEAGRVHFQAPPDEFFTSDDPRLVRFLGHQGSRA